MQFSILTQKRGTSSGKKLQVKSINIKLVAGKWTCPKWTHLYFSENCVDATRSILKPNNQWIYHIILAWVEVLEMYLWITYSNWVMCVFMSEKVNVFPMMVYCVCVWFDLCSWQYTIYRMCIYVLFPFICFFIYVLTLFDNSDHIVLRLTKLVGIGVQWWLNANETLLNGWLCWYYVDIMLILVRGKPWVE